MLSYNICSFAYCGAVAGVFLCVLFVTLGMMAGNKPVDVSGFFNIACAGYLMRGILSPQVSLLTFVSAV